MFTSVSFWALVAVAFAVVRLLPDANVRTRALTLALVGAAGLLEVLALPPWVVAFLVAVIAWVSLGPGLASRLRPAMATLLVAGPVVAVWMVGKQAVAANVAAFAGWYFVGFSFFVVKAWTLTRDRVDGRIPAYDPLIGAAYFLHLPTYLSGPMHYYGEFATSLRQPRALTAVGIVDIAFRLLLGLVKVTVLSPLLAPISLSALKDVAHPSVMQLVEGAFGYSLVIYFDFSGYTDMAVATSRLLGIDVPENFNYPYLAVNIREFWRRWHITFSRVLTSYVFVPVTRALQPRLATSPRTLMVAGYLVTFGLAGYWHGPTANFLAWGLYHAAGLIAYDLFRGWRTRRALADRRTLGAPTAAGRVIGVIVTFVFVSLGWILFVLPLSALPGVAR